MKKLPITLIAISLLIFSQIPINVLIIIAEIPGSSSFGYASEGSYGTNIENRIVGTWGEATGGNGTADYIEAYFKVVEGNGSYSGNVTAGLYSYITDNDAGLMLLNGQTEEKHITIGEDSSEWIRFNFTSIKPLISNNSKYFCIVSAENTDGILKLMATSNQPGYSIYKIESYDSTLPLNLTDEISSTYRRSIYCSYTIIPDKAPPILSGERPENGSIGIYPNPVCNITIDDINQENLTVFFYENTSGDWVLQQASTDIQSGDNVIWINYTNASDFLNMYWWKVCCFDGTFWTNQTFHFTTRPENYIPIVSNEEPLNGSKGNIFNPALSVDIEDFDEEQLKVIFMSNQSGIWQELGNYNGGNERYFQNTSGMNLPNTSYFWSVHVSDLKVWNNITYSYTTKLENNYPILVNETPSNGSIGVAYNPNLSLDVQDSDEEPLTVIFMSNVSGSWQELGNYTGGNGRYSQVTSMMNLSETMYFWSVHVFDSKVWVNKTYYFITRPENYLPVISNEEPLNNSVGISYNPLLSAVIEDLDEELLTVVFKSNSSGSWQELGNYTGGNGKFTQETSVMNSSDTLYFWSIHVFDSKIWVNETFHFTTRPENFIPVISNEEPLNGSTGVHLNPVLSVDIEDLDEELLTIIFKSNVTGSWQELGNYTGGNGRYSQSVSDMNITNKTYYWSIHVTDSKVWINNTNFFTIAESIMPTIKWFNTTDVGTTATGPLVADVNADGKIEVIRSGLDGVIVIDAETGDVVWTKLMTMWNAHCPLEIIDLNKDGILEILFSYEYGTMAVHGNNGSVYWYNPDAPLHNKYAVTGDIDADGYPEVFVTTSIGGSITALTHDGKIFSQTYTYYPCFSGLSLGDTDQDGVFELYLNERSVDYHDNGLGKGVRAMWASNLTDRWYRDDILCSSHCPALVDVDKDGKLDVVSLQQSGGGIIVLNSTDGSEIHYTKDIPGLGCHSQPTIHDIDNDGNLEIIACRDSKPIVWDLYNWEAETGGLLDGYGRLPYICYEPPAVADITGDGNVEILACTYSNITIFNNEYEIIGTFQSGGSQTQAFIVAQDVDNDSLTELVLNRGSSVYIYDTIAPLPIPRAVSQFQFYSQHRGRSPYFTQYGPLAPVIKDESPINHEINYSINPALLVSIYDYQNDLMNITFQTNASGTWKEIKSYTSVKEGTYAANTTNMNSIDTVYWWRIKVTDINGYSRDKLYNFTTTITKPILSNPLPVNNTIDIQITPILSIETICYQGPEMNILFRTNASGTWKTIGSNLSVVNGIFTCDNTSDMSIYDTMYWWSVNATDLGTGKWTNKTYFFMTEFNDPPVISNVVPTPDEIDVSIHLSQLQFNLSDDENDILNYTVETSPDIGSAIGTITGGGMITVDVSNITYSSSYIWYVNVSDPFGPGNWTREIYQFSIEASTVDAIYPYELISSPHTINASGYHDLDNVSLYYRWSENNWSADWTILTYDTFEGESFDWGNWSDGGADCKSYTDGSYAYNGSNALNLEDNSYQSYTELTYGLDLDNPNYTQVLIDFWAYYVSIEDDEYLEVYFDGNSVWKYYPVFENQFIHHTILVNEFDYVFDNDMKIRFEAEFSGGSDDVYIDQIYINASTNIDWNSWNTPSNPDDLYPWSWEFDFPYETGYYQFYSKGMKSGSIDESIPDFADARCHYIKNSPAILNSYPLNDATNMPISMLELNVTLIDYQNDTMNYTITTVPDIIDGQQSHVGIINGTVIHIPITQMLEYSTIYTWDVQVTDGTFWTNETFSFSTRPEPARWWNSNWQYRKEICINHTKVAGYHTNFPILISINSDDSLLNHTLINGNDIVFTNYFGNKLNHEIETCNKTTGALTAWINITNLSSISDTFFYMYYGNENATNMQNPAGVWDSNYLAVHHFNETMGQHQDSTSNNNDSVNVTVNVQGGYGGIVSRCDILDGTDNYIQFPNKKFAAGQEELTIELWINPDENVSSSTTIYEEWNGENYWQYTLSFDGFFTRDASGGPTESRDNDIALYQFPTIDSWNYVTTWYSISSGEKRIYLDGSIDAYSKTNVGTLTDDRNINSPRIGYASDGANFSGKVDEFRVSKIARSTEWLQTTYNTIISPTTFLVIGGEETPRIILFNETPLNNDNNVNLSPQLSIQIEHPAGNLTDVIFMTNASSGVWHQIGSTQQGNNGTYYQQSFDMNNYSTTYWWSVYATDGILWTNETYKFTIMDVPNTPPVIIEQIPLNGSLDNEIFPILEVTVDDFNNDILNAYWLSNSSGSWEEFGSTLNINTSDGAVNITMMNPNYNSYLTTYYWIVYVTDGEDWIDEKYWFTTKNDTDPPIITNIKANPNPQQVNKSVNISCDIIEYDEVDKVKVHITYPDNSTHNETMLGGSYYYSAIYSLIGTYTYYIWVNDTSENINISSNYSFDIVESIVIHYNISLQQGWNLISLPFNQSVDIENVTINYLGMNYTWNQAVENSTVLPFIYRWDAETQNYGFTDIINPGEGHWLYANNACDMWISAIILDYDSYITDLSIGWNLIGLPFNISVAKENLTIFYDGTEYTWNQAVGSNIVLSFIYEWSKTLQNYRFTTILNPGQGYFLYANDSCRLYN